MGREYPAAPVAAVGAVVRYQGKILLVQRGQEPSRGRWVLPGGGIELGESAEEAVRREIREECGIEITVGPPAAVVDRVVRDDDGRVRYHYLIVDFFAACAAGDLRPGSDAMDARWVSLEELPAYGAGAKTEELARQALAR